MRQEVIARPEKKVFSDRTIIRMKCHARFFGYRHIQVFLFLFLV